MKKNLTRPVWIAGLLIALAGTGAAVSVAADALPGTSLAARHARIQARDAAAGRVMVRFKPGASVLPHDRRILASRFGPSGPQAAGALAKRHALDLSDGRMLDERTQVVKARGVDSATLRARLLADPEVEAVWFDGRRFAKGTIPNDPLFSAISTVDDTRVQAGQWYLRTPNSALVSSIDAPAAWRITWGDPAMVVADIDTGIRPEHPDLAGKILPGYDMIADVPTANDGDARDSNPTDVGDWITAAEDASGQFKDCGISNDLEPSSWHGTQTAGIIAAATDNGIGMAGTGRDVKVLPVRVLGKCGGYDSDIIAGMRWAAGFNVPGTPLNAHPARVLNMSLGGAETTGTNPQNCATTHYNDTITDLTNGNVVVVVAAGNETAGVDIPAKCPGVIAVAATRASGEKVGFSNFGPEVAISAPGGNCVNSGPPCLYPILSTTNTGTTTAVSSSYTFDDRAVGTSFSTPQVAGTVALMLSVNPALTNAQVLSMLQSSARPFIPVNTGSGLPVCPQTSTADSTSGQCYCTTSTCGAGMLDAGAAVAKAVGQTGVSVDMEPAWRTVAVGETMSLDAQDAVPTTGATIPANGYTWTILSGGSAAAFTGATTGSVVSLQGVALGPVTVEVTVTDTAGKVGRSLRTLQVAPLDPVAIPGTASGTLSVGATVIFDGSGSTASGPRSVTSYQWSLAAGDTAATIKGAANQPTVTLQGVSAGSVTLSLVVTDSEGHVSSPASQAVTVMAAVDGGGGGSSGGGGGGGGAFGALSCLGLAAALAALRKAR